MSRRNPLVAEAHERLDASLRRFVGGRVSASDVDDLMQEVYLRLAQVDAEVEHLSGFVHRVARNAVADFHRRREVRPDLPEDDTAPDVALQVASWLGPMIDALDEPYRTALQLAELEAMSHADASAQLGIPRSTFSSRVQRGRELLRKQLTDCCAIELDVRHHVTGFEPKDGCC